MAPNFTSQILMQCVSNGFYSNKLVKASHWQVYTIIQFMSELTSANKPNSDKLTTQSHFQEQQRLFAVGCLMECLHLWEPNHIPRVFGANWTRHIKRNIYDKLHPKLQWKDTAGRVLFLLKWRPYYSNNALVETSHEKHHARNKKEASNLITLSSLFWNYATRCLPPCFYSPSGENIFEQRSRCNVSDNLI